MCECLPFKPYRQKDFEWNKIDINLYMSEKKLLGITYYLYVEEVDNNDWLATLLINDNIQWQSDVELKSLFQAKKSIVKALNLHRQKV